MELTIAMKKRRKMMFILLGTLMIIIGTLLVFFNISYSKTRTEFKNLVSELASDGSSKSELFTEADLSGMPFPVMRYFRYCGYIGTPVMNSVKISYRDVDFSFGKGKAPIKIDYTQYNFVMEPARLAYIDSSMYGIPFEGLDTFYEGKGAMKGLIAKCFTVFYNSGKAMDEASLVNCLSECLLLPSAALQDYIKWEEIDNTHAKAIIQYDDMKVSGIFSFDENGEMLSFTTDDRDAVLEDGSSKKIRWSAVCKEYKEENGIRKPTVFQAVWHYEDGDFIYFNGKDVKMEFNPKN